MHKLRRCTRRMGRDRLDDDVQVDQTYVGRRCQTHGRGTSKALIVIAAERRGRTRMEHGTSLKETAMAGFFHRNCAPSSIVTTDSLQSYSQRTVAPRSHHRVNLRRLDIKSEDPLHQCHRVANLLKRWLLGTYHGSASRTHLAAHLDEYAFRFNRRKTRGVGRVAARQRRARADVRAFLHHQVRRPRHGAAHLSHHRRGPRRPLVGDEEPRPRTDRPVHDTGGTQFTIPVEHEDE